MTKTLDELRLQIAEYAPIVDTPVDPFAHNIVGLCLSQIDREFGTAEANKAIDAFDLEEKGWHKLGVCKAGDVRYKRHRYETTGQCVRCGAPNPRGGD